MNNRDQNQKRYDNTHCIRISLKLNCETDKDILDKIDMSQKQKSIKELIRNGMKSSK